MSSLLLADDHQLFREALRALLELQGFTVVADAADGLGAVSLAEKHQPDVAVLDLIMPGLNGIDAARAIVQVAPRTRCLLLTMHTDEQYVLAAMRGNISGYVLKTKAAAELVQAIREVCAGHTYLSPGITRAVVDALGDRRGARDGALTLRERQVLQLIAEGKTNKETAVVLGMSVKTTESHRTRLMRKLAIHETAGLVRYAIRHGIVEA